MKTNFTNYICNKLLHKSTKLKAGIIVLSVLVCLTGCNISRFNFTKDTEKETVIEAVIDADDIPKYDGKNDYVDINDGIPFFTEEDKASNLSFEKYSNLDKLGRCQTAYACIGKDLMPTEKRGEIGFIKPTGWHTIKYDCVDGLYLFNRCHLIGYQLTGENANEKNLITGTRYFNAVLMLQFENETADYIHNTGNHVLYRVTPVFKEDDLLCEGVLMEAYSVEDNGSGVCFCVFVYNIQPGIVLDYETGDSKAKGN